MKYLRATIRLLTLSVVTVGSHFLLLAGLPFSFAFPDAARAWRGRNLRFWARACARVLGLRINVSNPPPRAPFLLVSNHLSYVDIIVLSSQVDCVFVAKSEVAAWPIFGLMCRTANTIFIDRNRKRDILRAMQRIKSTLAHGVGVVLFAEGTSTDGRQVSPFKSSLLELAARERVPVHYASISYLADDAAVEETICWWGDMTFPGHIFRLLQLPRFEASLTFGPAPIVASNRHVLAAQLWSAVSAQLKPAAERGLPSV